MHKTIIGNSVESSTTSGATKSVVGRLPSNQSPAVVTFDHALLSVDDLIQSPSAEVAWLTPGFIDLQVNGFAGVDYNDPAVTAEDVSRSVASLFATGITRFFATVITAPEQHIVACLANLARIKEELARNDRSEAVALEAFHVEGPHISPEDGPRGAHPLAAIRPPDIEEFFRWQEAARGNIRLVTVSPEWDGMAHYIKRLVRAGVVASIGHTKATSSQIAAAVDAGATLSTHLGNAAHPALPKTANYIWDQLADDRLAACFINDGIHVPAPFLRAAVRAKGPERSVLVTDAVMPAMCSPGPYRLGEVEVELHSDGRVTKRASDRLAGSALRMDVAVANTLRTTGLPLATVLAMASANAARVGRIPGRQRGLAPGEKADLIRFTWNDERILIQETIVAGTAVYSV